MSVFDFESDEDTEKLFEVVSWCLQRYFSHTPESALRTINHYYNEYRSSRSDDFYHHEGPYWVALLIHYCEDLRGEAGQFHAWRVQSGYQSIPAEVHEYFRTHYLS